MHLRSWEDAKRSDTCLRSPCSPFNSSVIYHTRQDIPRLTSPQFHVAAIGKNRKLKDWRICRCGDWLKLRDKVDLINNQLAVCNIN